MDFLSFSLSIFLSLYIITCLCSENNLHFTFSLVDFHVLSWRIYFCLSLNLTTVLFLAQWPPLFHSGGRGDPRPPWGIRGGWFTFAAHLLGSGASPTPGTHHLAARHGAHPRQRRQVSVPANVTTGEDKRCLRVCENTRRNVAEKGEIIAGWQWVWVKEIRWDGAVWVDGDERKRKIRPKATTDSRISNT